MSLYKFVRASAALLLFGASAFAVQPPLLPRPIAHPIPGPPLTQVIQASGYIFQGTVTQVRWIKAKNPQDVASVQITFRVTQGIRGVQAGQMLSVREWAGLWDRGERYQPDQRVVLFLYHPSKLGLTSPVAGPLSKFVVETNGAIQLNEQQRILLSGEPRFAPAIRTHAPVKAQTFASTILQLARREP
jgi:hypothetical protein